MVRCNRAIRSSFVLASLGIVFSATLAWAQEEAEQPAEQPVRQGIVVMSDAGGGAGVIQIETAGAMATPLRLAPMSGAYGFSFGGSGAWANSINWVNDPNLLDELEIIDEQREKLEQIRDDISKRRSDFFQSFRNVEPEKRGEFIVGS